MNFLKDSLKDCEGQPSSMRLMSFIALVAAIVFGGADALGVTEADPENLDGFVKWLLGAAFGPKAVQKFAEGGTKS